MSRIKIDFMLRSDTRQLKFKYRNFNMKNSFHFSYVFIFFHGCTLAFDLILLTNIQCDILFFLSNRTYFFCTILWIKNAERFIWYSTISIVLLFENGIKWNIRQDERKKKRDLIIMTSKVQRDFQFLFIFRSSSLFVSWNFSWVEYTILFLNLNATLVFCVNGQLSTNSTYIHLNLLYENYFKLYIWLRLFFFFYISQIHNKRRT